MNSVPPLPAHPSETPPRGSLAQARIAVVHDWLTSNTGAERVLAEILRLYPQAHLFTLVDTLPPAERAFLEGHPITTSFLQRLPGGRSRYRDLLPLMPLAIEQLDVTGFDLVISSSWAVAKGVITAPDQPHISYIHTPMRYIWDLQFEYLSQLRGWKALLRPYTRRVFHQLRLWDQLSSQRVDHLACNSRFVASRIRKFYRRSAEVIHPPADLEEFPLITAKGDYFLCVSRLVPYKKVDVVVEAFRQMPHHQLIVIGSGPEEKRLRARLPQNVTLVPFLPRDQLSTYLQHARALVFAALEDFGIIVVEAQACGTPVIAYGRGGSLETVRGPAHPRPTGMFFPEQTPESIVEAVQTFLNMGDFWQPEHCRANAERFSSARFRSAFSRLVETGWYNFGLQTNQAGAETLID